MLGWLRVITGLGLVSRAYHNRASGVIAVGQSGVSCELFFYSELPGGFVRYRNSYNPQLYALTGQPYLLLGQLLREPRFPYRLRHGAALSHRTHYHQQPAKQTAISLCNLPSLSL